MTGATGGIGRAVAERLAARGAELVLIGRRAAALDELAARVGAMPLAADISNREQLGVVATRVDAIWREVPDVLVNGAGTFELAAFAETKPAVFERHFAVNLRAPFELIRAWLAGMLDRGSGHMVNVGSVAGRAAFPGNAAYCASKFGLRALHEVLVEEVRGTGVRATWIEPSAVDTPLWDPIDTDARDGLPSRGEMLQPEAVAEAICFAIAQPEHVAVEEIAIRANVRVRRA